MKVWWSRSPANGNFGDILTPIIFKHYGIKCEYEIIKNAEAISTGSIIRFARPNQLVLGSGAMWANDKIEPNAQYLFVRGPITGELVRNSGNECTVYGDPALLLPRIFSRDVEPTQEVGFFAHYVDLDTKHPYVINPLGSPVKVLKKIWNCKRIISSSLHGIIASHAYGIPAAWVKLNKLDGDDTKFHDYALSVGLDGMPLSTLDNPDFTLPTIDATKIDSIMRTLSGH